MFDFPVIYAFFWNTRTNLLRGSVAEKIGKVCSEASAFCHVSPQSDLEAEAVTEACGATPTKHINLSGEVRHLDADRKVRGCSHSKLMRRHANTGGGLSVHD